MAAEADVIPPAVATPTPTAVISREVPKVMGARARPTMAAAPPTALVLPPEITTFLAFSWYSLMSSAMACSLMMANHRNSARSVKTWLKRRRPRSTLSDKMLKDLEGCWNRGWMSNCTLELINS